MMYFNEELKSDDFKSQKFDLFITVSGYEDRCKYIAEEILTCIKDKVCLEFPGHQNKENISFFHSNGFKIFSTDSTDSFNYIENYIIDNSGDSISIAIDVSSMTREIQAKLLYLLINFKPEILRKVTILYAPVVFVKPQQSLATIEISEPVTDAYSGWSERPDAPLFSVIGLGYEYGRAIGSLEYLDVADAWFFKAIGEDPKFEDAVDNINKDLIGMYGANQLIEYKLSDPYDTFIQLRSLVEGLLKTGRVVFLPFGPKLFNAICIIVAELFPNDVTVWRVSAGANSEYSNYDVSGKIISFSFMVESKQ